MKQQQTKIMEKINDKMLTNAALAFVLTLIVVMLVQGWMAPEYSLTNEQVQQQMLSEEVLVLPVALKQMNDNGSLAGYTLVDLGDTPTLSISGGAEVLYIPFQSLLEKQNLRLLKKSDKLLLFGTEESQAMMAGQLLLSKGVKNLKVATNSISFNNDLVSKTFDPRKAETQTEKARFDYSRYFKGEPSGAKSATAPGSIPQGVKVVKAAGGC